MSKTASDKLTAEFKKNLKAILEDRKDKTNPKKLSIDAGLGETAIRDILQNRSASPKLETIHKIAGALNVPVYRLIPSMIDQSYDAYLSEYKSSNLYIGISFSTTLITGWTFLKPVIKPEFLD